jgi:hypothetical protein
MDIAVKYCGGCNPYYDRGALIQKLQHDFPEIRLVGPEAPPDGEPDLLVVVGGCPACCASHKHLNAKHGKVFISAKTDYEKLHAKVARLIDS